MTARNHPRGYLLAEAMVAGALLAVSIGATLGIVASAAADSRYATNRGTASMLARAKADELASTPDCAPGDQVGFAVVDAARYPQFRWQWTVVNAANSASSTPPVTAGALCDIHVAVRYPAARNGREDRADGTVDGEAVVDFSRLYKP